LIAVTRFELVGVGDLLGRGLAPRHQGPTLSAGHVEMRRAGSRLLGDEIVGEVIGEGGPAGIGVV